MPYSSEQDSYLTLAGKSSGIYKDRGSKFLYFAFRVENEEEIKAELAALRKIYFDATHHCYAWILGPQGAQFRANDDGEPNHSAGDPILGQIRSHQLTQVLIVVVRYFGGTKLGVSGLINAYKTSASLAIEESEIVKKWVLGRITIQFPYASMNEVMKLIKSEQLTIVNQELGLDCVLTLEMRMGLLEGVTAALSEIEGLLVKND
ncbi:putative YigZ family protein [Algoriphagus aquaeductus]|uniref:Putative YigZ family protein n=1 Tax=Algoriphagus aquaeductus TaxID=475299 RepID=A0A326RVC3_9BACT|nr:YigZ family protein [Algoriphagus aquaeductus]PZV85464.1 putative YigZ family protein [Algoriphagus aquaeductus]